MKLRNWLLLLLIVSSISAGIYIIFTKSSKYKVVENQVGPVVEIENKSGRFGISSIRYLEDINVVEVDIYADVEVETDSAFYKKDNSGNLTPIPWVMADEESDELNIEKEIHQSHETLRFLRCPKFSVFKIEVTDGTTTQSKSFRVDR